MAIPMIVRPQQTFPLHCTDSHAVSANISHRIEFKHPGYSDDSNVFLTLPAPDGSEGGLDHDTARIACGILVGNRWDGFFSHDIDSDPIEASVYPVLPKGSYFFNLPYQESDPNPNHPYPLVPTFTQWRFPHRNLPPIWSQESNPILLPSSSSARSNLSQAIVLRDQGKCRISSHEEACELAHLCPAKENDWFHSNEMYKYVYDMRRTGVTAIDDLNNLLLMRADLHKLFDDQKFIFVPKETPDGSHSFVTHLLCHSRELSYYYHNTTLQNIDTVPREFLFARFAWSLFPFLEGFLQANTERAVMVRLGRRMASSEECKSYTNLRAARSRTASPKKRKADDDTEASQQEQESVRNVSQDDDSIHKKQHTRKRRKHTSKCSRKATPAALNHESSPFSSSSPKNTDAASPNTIADLCQAPNEEEARLFLLKERFLSEERVRSDKIGSWKRELDWAQRAIKRPVTPETLRVIYEIMGYDVLDDRSS